MRHIDDLHRQTARQFLSNTIAKEIPILIKDGTYVHPWLEISGGKITPDISQSAGLPKITKVQFSQEALHTQQDYRQ